MKRALMVCGVLLGTGTAHADELDRASIAAGIGSVKAKVAACGDKFKAGGTIKVTVTVGADGKVTSALRTQGMATTDTSDLNEKLGACVVGAIKTATFKPSAHGGSFSYPFVFGAPATASPAAGPPPSPPAGPVDASMAPPPVDGELDRTSITEGIAFVKAKVMACGDKIKVSGTIKVMVTVGANGKVTSAKRSAGDEKLGACVVEVIKKATFKTTKGGAFSYPFVFGTGAAASMPAPPPPGAGGSALDRSMITDGIAAVKSKIQACGDGNKAKGKVKIKVSVAPAGTVTNADVEATPDAKLGACVADVLLHATFAKTGQGGSFSYPFVF